MNERQKTLLRLAVCYALANMNDFLDAFAAESESSKLYIDFNGEIIEAPVEDEFEQLMKELQ